MLRYLENYWPADGGFSAVNAVVSAIAWPDELETRPMAQDGSNGNHGGREGGVESRK